MDFIRSSLKVSAAALLTAPVLLTPLASANRSDSSANRLAASPAPVVRTDSLDHAMNALVAQFSAPKQRAGAVLPARQHEERAEVPVEDVFETPAGAPAALIANER